MKINVHPHPIKLKLPSNVHFYEIKHVIILLILHVRCTKSVALEC